MQPLTAFWKAHRLGVFYGLLWSFVALAIDSINGFDFLWGSSQHPSALVSWLVTLAASLPAGVLVTHVLRRVFSAGGSGSRLLPGTLLSLFLGTMTYVGLTGALTASVRLALDGSLETYHVANFFLRLVSAPFYAFTIPFGPVLVPLAGLNTWHLYRRLRSVQVAPQPAGLA